MKMFKKKKIHFKSSDGKTPIAGYLYCNEEKPFCILQLSHGMCEYVERYEEFAAFLVEHRVFVVGNDHIGHGKSIVTSEDWGYFGGKNGRRFVMKDLHIMNRYIHQKFPGVPVIMLGHSMGSFFARRYAVQWPNSIDGLIISGTGGPNPLVGLGILATNVIGKVKGERYRSELVNKMAFGVYLKHINNPKTEYDWISRDEEIVSQYNQDPCCTFRFTVSGFHEVFCALKEVSGFKWAERIPKDMPVFLCSGDADPVGAYAQGVKKVIQWLQDANVQDITYKIYHEGRHEMLNEINRQDVYKDFLEFLSRWDT